MNRNRALADQVDYGAEGGTLGTGQRDQHKTRHSVALPKSSVPKHGQAEGREGADKGRGDGSFVQCGCNGSDVQGPWKCRKTTWVGAWLEVYGPPIQLWELLLTFAALIGMRPGDWRRLDEEYTFRLFEGEAGGMLDRRGDQVALVVPFGASWLGSPLPELELESLEFMVHGAIQRVEALGAESDLYRYAANLIRCLDGPAGDRWATGADLRGPLGQPLDAPHPDAHRFSLVGALRQAWAEQGGGGLPPVASLRRLAALAASPFGPWSSTGADLCLDVLRVWNDAPRQTAGTVLALLERAANDADADAESRVWR